MDDARWKDGLTAWQLLESAIRDKVNPGDAGDLQLAQEALDKGADINEVHNGWTALMYAVIEDDAAMLQWLIARGARGDGRAVMEAARSDAAAALAVLLAHGYGPEWDVHGDTPISLAARDGKYRVVSLLVKAGADVDHCDDSGQSARMYLERAGRRDLLEREAEVAQPLLESGPRRAARLV